MQFCATGTWSDGSYFVRDTQERVAFTVCRLRQELLRLTLNLRRIRSLLVYSISVYVHALYAVTVIMKLVNRLFGLLELVVSFLTTKVLLEIRAG
jgi:hypothetical protein